MKQMLNRIETAFNYPIDIVLRHFEKRQFELAMALIMVGLGAFLFVSPASLSESAMRYLLHTLSIWTVIVVFFLGGVARIIALALNGHWMPGGAYVRAFGAAVGAIMWGQWGASLYELHQVTGSAVSPGVVVYGVLALFELVSFSRALRGAANERAYKLGAGSDRRLGHQGHQSSGVHGHRAIADPAGAASLS